MKSSRRGVRSEGRKLTFNFVYPNLSLVAHRRMGILTHGHYFEAYWALASDWLMPIAAEALAVETPGQLNLQELVGMDLPLNQLACSGIGQAEPLTALYAAAARPGVRTPARRHPVPGSSRGAHSGDRTNTSRIRRAAERYVVRRIKQWLLAWLGSHPQAATAACFCRPSVRDRFRRYYRHSLNELSQLSREHGIHVPAPSHVVFGHTHQPIPWGAVSSSTTSTATRSDSATPAAGC